MLALLVLFVPTTFFWATYEQQGNTIALWADDYTDRSIDLIVWRGEIPTTWFQAFNPFMIFAFTPFIVALWGVAGAARQRALDRGQDVARLLRGGDRQSDHGRRRLAVGRGAGRELAVAARLFRGHHHRRALSSPIGLSLVSKVSPTRIVSMMMGCGSATSFTGNFIAGWLGSFWSSMDKMMFFLMIAGIATLAGAAILAFDRPLWPVLKE